MISSQPPAEGVAVVQDEGARGDSRGGLWELRFCQCPGKLSARSFQLLHRGNTVVIVKVEEKNGAEAYMIMRWIIRSVPSNPVLSR